MKITPDIISALPKQAEKAGGPGHDVDEAQLQSAQQAVGAATVRVSSMARDFADAVVMLEEEEAVRPEMVEQGRHTMAQWQPLSDGQIDSILHGVFQDG